MTPEQVSLVQESFKKVPAESAAVIFYDRLFEVAPHLRSLFKSDMKEQRTKLMATLTVAVAGLNSIEQLLPVVRDLGARHAGYGVKPEHYQTVGETLLWTLEQGLGDAFTEDVEQAWTEVYGLLSSTMIRAGIRAVA